jgi:hypothetical protein
MESTDTNTLVIEAPVGRHFAQMHRSPRALEKSVALFVETGLRRGNGVVMFVAPQTEEAVMEHLDGTDVDAMARRQMGQLSVHDAQGTLDCFMKRGMPDWTLFRNTILEAMEGSQSFGRGATRAYGEMVNILWRRGQQIAAIKLEEYWNEIARTSPLSLFCGYTIDSYDHASYAGPLDDIGRTHDHVIVGEEDDRFRAALDAASKDIFGIPLTQMLSRRPKDTGDERLPLGQRTMLWIMRNFPTRSAEVLEGARNYHLKATSRR